MSVMWSDGVYLGLKGKTGEIIVGDEKGIWKTRTIQRKPMAERWMRSSVDMVKHVPWRTSEGDPKADGEKPEVIKLNPEQEHVEREIMKDAAPRRAYITKEDLNELGYTAKCPGCLAILRGTARQGHSADCRKRVEGLAGGLHEGDRFQEAHEGVRRKGRGAGRRKT